jgi:hypothetical protein
MELALCGVIQIVGDDSGLDVPDDNALTVRRSAGDKSIDLLCGFFEGHSFLPCVFTVLAAISRLDLLSLFFLHDLLSLSE